ncbi:MAG: glycosyl transferase family 2, partial [Natronomonas sp.]
PRLLYPLSHGRSFSKGYYARVENDGLYGRLFRLFVRPLLSTLEAETDAAICEYLAAFRYALAGEFAMTGDLARRMRIQRRWGLEIGTLGEAFRLAGTDDTAQIDLGIHRHDHRSVSGPSGLSEMAEQVGEALFRAVEENGPTPDYETLPERYRSTADRLVDAYELDAGFNDLSFDAADERRQVETYADAIAAPGVDDRLPAWDDAPLSVATIVDDVSADLAEAREG